MRKRTLSKGKIPSPHNSLRGSRKESIIELQSQVKPQKEEAIHRRSLKHDYCNMMREFKKSGNSSENKPKESEKVLVWSEKGSSQTTIEHYEEPKKEPKVERHITFDNIFGVGQKELKFTQSPKFVEVKLEEKMVKPNAVQKKDKQVDLAEVKRQNVVPLKKKVITIKNEKGYIPIGECNTKLESIRSQLGKINEDIETINSSIEGKLLRLELFGDLFNAS